MLPPNGVGPKGVAAPNSSKVRVIIVGLGIAGLTAAIECHRKGHSVIAFDRLDVLQRYGDVIGIGANGGMVIGQWGNEVRDALREWIHVTPQLDIYDGNGKSIGQHTYSATHEEKYMLRRSMLADIMYRQAQSLGIDMRLGVKVSDFWEDDHEAGVIVNGEKIGADCVIGADGAHSKARAFIFRDTGIPPLRPSGFAMFRGWVDRARLAGDPRTKWFEDQIVTGARLMCFHEQGTFAVLGGYGQGKDRAISCAIIRQNEDTLHNEEVWNTPADFNQIVRLLGDWTVGDKLLAICEKIDRDALIDCPLLRMDSLERWVSSHGRVLLIGDAAHVTPPTSGQGGGQAIEDAAVLSICLELAGRENVPLALRATETIRKPRATYVQKNGFSAQMAMFGDDWKKEGKDDNELPSGSMDAWIWEHDCQSHAYSEYAKVVKALKENSVYTPTNLAESVIGTVSS